MSGTDTPAAQVARDVTAVVDASLPHLAAIGEERAGAPTAPGKWSRKQVLGHN